MEIKSTWERNGIKIYIGDCVEVMNKMPDKSVHCCVTSPPYWGLRSYLNDNDPEKNKELGDESTPEEYVTNMVEVFRALRRVLRDDGTVWLNLGDTYSGGGSASGGNIGGSIRPTGHTGDKHRMIKRPPGNLKSGNLVGIPWRVALALQADGWVLRQDIIWHKPSPMPESISNRCTKAHEYIFLLAKSMKYYYDSEAIKTKTRQASLDRCKYQYHYNQEDARKQAKANTIIGARQLDNSSNKRSVWTIASQSYNDAHFATFPEKLIEPCILAGTSSHGCCAKCGSPYKRIIERLNVPKVNHQKRDGIVESKGSPYLLGIAKGKQLSESYKKYGFPKYKTLGWQPTCSCGAKVIPCIVFDPFAGSGTTLAVAAKHLRNGIGIDLNKEYLDLCKNRVNAVLDKPNIFRIVEKEVKNARKRTRIRM